MTIRSNLQVLALPSLDPAADRIDVTLPEGMTVAEIVSHVLPGATPGQLARCRVTLATEAGAIVVTPTRWAQVRPRAGVNVIVRVVPGKTVLKSVLQIVVAVAAIAIGSFFTPILGGLLSGLLAAGVTLVGNLLINALIPPQKAPDAADQDAARSLYSITGLRNSFVPNGMVPDIAGRHRYAAPFGAMSWTEVVGDDQYIRALFNYGYGPVSFSEHKIGDTAIESFDEISLDVRTGLPGDAPLDYFRHQVLEESVGTELIRPLPRTDDGTPTGAPGVATPTIRYTAANTTAMSVIVYFPSGLISYDDKGNPQGLLVSISVRARQLPGGGWFNIDTMNIWNKKREGFYRQISYSLPGPGRYAIEVERLTDERTSSQEVDRVVLAAIQSWRPEYPINMSTPLALIAVRIKATHQLNGALETFNSVVDRLLPDWDKASQSWIVRATRNPAAHFRHALQGPATSMVWTNAQIDFQQIEDWHEWCAMKDLKYDRVHDFEASLMDTLSVIAAAGRASPRFDSGKWGVVIDRPQSLVVDHINPRNSRGFRWSRTYFEPPHAFRVPFIDATNDYQSAERVVRWPGYAGEVTLTEQLELPGKTDPNEIWREARRRMYELMHRPDRYTVTQDGAARVATRGDLVMCSWDVLDRTQKAVRVKSIYDRLMVIDDTVEMRDGENYGVRFRVYGGGNDTVGQSLVRPVITDAGERTTLQFASDAVVPALGEIIHFGPIATESSPMIVLSVEPGEDFSSVITLVDAAPIIDELTDAEVPPPWSGRVGAELDPDALAPAVPKFTSIASGIVGTGSESGLVVQLAAGSSGIVATTRFDLEHRLFGSPGWTVLNISAGSSGASIAGYTKGNSIQLRARARSSANVPSLYSPIANVTIGSGDGAIPAALPSGSIVVTAGLGSAAVTFVTGSDAATTQVQLYRSATLTLNRTTDAIGPALAVSPSASFTRIDGDATRANDVLNPSFVDASAWSAGTGWTIGAGVAAHAPGSAGDIDQPMMLTAGSWYRIAFALAAYVEGDVRPRLSGTADVDGAPVDANGYYLARLQAVSGNDTFGFHGSIDFDGALDTVTLYRETAQCVPQGVNYYWIEPQNENGLPGPVAGPFASTII